MNALTVNQPRSLSQSLQPRNQQELWQFAEQVARTPFVPAAYRGKPADVATCVMYGADLGFSPMQSLQNIAVVNGKPSIYGDGLRALVMGRDDCQGIEDGFEGAGDEYHAWVTVHRRGKKPVTRRFSLADAKSANLLGKQGPWSQYRDRMLLMRANGFAIRDAYADVLRGVLTYEEARDIPAGPDHARDITPPEPVTTIDVTTRVTVIDENGEANEIEAVEAAAWLIERAKLIDGDDWQDEWFNMNVDAMDDETRVKIWNAFPKPAQTWPIYDENGEVMAEDCGDAATFLKNIKANAIDRPRAEYVAANRACLDAAKAAFPGKAKAIEEWETGE